MGCGSSKDNKLVPGTLQIPITKVMPHGVAEARSARNSAEDPEGHTSRNAALNKSLFKVTSLKEGMEPREVMQSLMEGNLRFVNCNSAHPHQDFKRIQALATGQKPQAAILGCADSRVPAEIVFDQGFGDVFVCRVAGNIATPEEVASLEYAVLDLGVKVVMVMGHTKCGAVKAAMSGKAFPGFIDTLVENLDVAIARVDSHNGIPAGGARRASHDLRRAAIDKGGHTHGKGGECGHAHAAEGHDAADAKMMDSVIRENVKYQMERCLRSSIMRDALLAGKLLLVGTVYDLDTGMVQVIDAFDASDVV